jgi:ABC-type branched-subunit amino acid transport system ATPase component
VNGSPNTAILSAAGIQKRFGALVVLDDIDFAMNADEAVGIVGPNGAGKTTLLSVLSGAFPPSAGTVAGHATLSSRPGAHASGAETVQRHDHVRERLCRRVAWGGSRPRRGL